MALDAFGRLRTSLYALRARREGRCKLKYEEQLINRCVLWANEDNCGCCEIDENLDDDFYSSRYSIIKCYIRIWEIL